MRNTKEGEDFVSKTYTSRQGSYSRGGKTEGLDIMVVLTDKKSFKLRPVDFFYTYFSENELIFFNTDDPELAAQMASDSGVHSHWTIREYEAIARFLATVTLVIKDPVQELVYEHACNQVSDEDLALADRFCKSVHRKEMQQRQSPRITVIPRFL